MCLGVGAPGGVKTISDMSGKAYGTAIDQAKTEFGDASTVFNDLMQSMAPIAKAGPGQTGWTAQEASAVNAATIDQTASAYKNASAAVREGIAAKGGGNIALPSGVNIATEAALAQAGAETEATGLRSNLIENLHQGNENWKFAEGGLEKAPSVFNTANEATSVSTGAGKEAFSEQQARGSYKTWGDIAMGALSAGVNSVLPGAGSILGGGSSSTGQES